MHSHSLYQGFDVFIVVLDVFTAYYYQSGCFKPNDRSTGQRILAYVGFGLVLGFFSLFYPNLLVLPTVSLAGIVLLSFSLYKGHWALHLIIATLYMFIVIVIEALVPLVQSLVTGLPLEILHADSAERVLGALTAKFIILSLTRIAVLPWGRHKGLFTRALKTIPLLLCQLILLLILVSNFALTYSADETTELTGLMLLELVGIIFISIVIFLYYDMTITAYEDQHKQQINTLQLASQMKYHAVVKDNLEKLLAIDHDLKKHRQVLESLLEREEYGQFKSYLTSLDQSVKTALADSRDLVNTDNAVIGALLSERLQQAESLGAEINIRVAVPEYIALDDIDLTIILGNTLDNALEAIALLPEPQRRLNINLQQSEHFFFCEIINPFDERQTKRLRHGLGLKNVKQAVDKYDGTFAVQTRDALFKVTITISAERITRK
jgi:sensor histidine kinase YesM